MSEALDSLMEMKVPDAHDVLITVIDNDAEKSALPVVNRFSQSAFPVLYECEAKRGIPFARNRAIDKALEFDADCLVFIDDDEKVDKDWLVKLTGQYYQEKARAVVSGVVAPLLPAFMDESIEQFFLRPKRLTGERLKHCATNNVLIPAYVYKELGIRFDESFPLAGGEDTLFFAEAVLRGVEIVVCAEAVVYEEIPSTRLNMRWLAKRKFRAGITLAIVDLRNNKSRVLQLAGALFKALYLIALSACLYLAGKRKKACWEFLRGYRTLGKIYGFLGMRKSDAYKYIDNSDFQ